MTRPLNWIAAMALASLATVPAFAAGASPVGKWQMSSGEARYQVTSCGSANLCAKLVWLRSDARTADNVALLDTYVVNGAQPAGDKTWAGNVNFNGHVYDGTMTLLSRNLMTLRGCSGMVCQTFQLTRL